MDTSCPPLFWSITYWLSIFAFSASLSIALARRGADDSSAPAHLLAMTRSAARPRRRVFLLWPCGSGGWYYYNAHVLNEYLNAKDLPPIQAEIRTRLQEVRTSSAAKGHRRRHAIDIFPERRSFSGTGRFVLQNKTSAADRADSHHRPQQSVRDVAFDRPFHIVSAGPRNLYSSTPSIAAWPGRKINMTFKVGHETRGFRDGNERAELAYNGTFFDSGYFPHIGYSADFEIDDPRRRREEHLGALECLPNRGDPRGQHSPTSSHRNPTGYLSHHRKHLGRSDRHLPRLPQKVDCERPPLLHLRHGSTRRRRTSSPSSPASFDVTREDSRVPTAPSP